ncbi:MAG: 4Fe-4S dicluster domain-containing protein [Planctomycetota bacterium]|nr:4Fe-4S dicluster domain-containing protein [Planctomycetota bacterium]MDP6941268.1 4Fe-4S dicluster domain-containing protein [Planctomycetota bacterium]
MADGRKITRRRLLAGAAWTACAAAGGKALGVWASKRAGSLRPPGASNELDFLAACIRCGQCVQVCPHESLSLQDLWSGPSAGSPEVDSRNNPCRLCEGLDELLCIEICPSGALAEVQDRRSIRMGTAVIDEERCLAFNKQICRACWHACPFLDEAIQLKRNRPVIVADICVGCGICDWACLTEPSSIRMVPVGET